MKVPAIFPRERVQDMVKQLLAPLRQWVNAELAPRYQRLDRREQQLVIAASCLLPVMLLVFMVILPMQDRQRYLRQRVETLQLQAMEARHLARQLLVNGKAKGVQPVSVLASVERMARQSKVREYMTRIRPQNTPGDRGRKLILQLKNAPYSDIVRFIDALSKEELLINSVKIQAGASAGRVHVKMVIGA